MMITETPYIVTTYKSVEGTFPDLAQALSDGYPVKKRSRRAVATLEEAGDHVAYLAFRADPTKAHALKIIGQLPGMIGPFADGTLIRVEPATYAELYDELPYATRIKLDRTSHAAIIDAWNAMTVPPQ